VPPRGNACAGLGLSVPPMGQALRACRSLLG
jgi:hypothetical protein